MPTYQGLYTKSVAKSTSQNSDITFGTDVAQSPVFLSADIIPSHSFARLMLALGQVVKMQDNVFERDHTAYQKWVKGEYIKELPQYQLDAAEKLPSLLTKKENLEKEKIEIQKIINKFHSAKNVTKETRAFWKWLYNHNREAWMILDPIVSVQSDATFFEAFSKDESTYARVLLPHHVTRTKRKPSLGTTNIDFSIPLEKELARTREYRPLHLTVGSDSVGIDTGISSTVEKKIDLPESWVKGLVEVQASLSLAPIQIDLSSSALADVIARLDSEREKHGPRSLIFDLVPGEPPQIIVEPWNDVFTVSDMPYQGSENKKIKVWGRRRLRVIKDLLPLTPKVNVRLIDSGMPSFWSLEIDEITLTIGLSGWTSQDWAGRARFSAIIPASEAPIETISKAADLLKDNGSLSVDELSTLLNSSPIESRRILQRLCLAGSAMFDPDPGIYRWRQLFPNLNLKSTNKAGTEERKGIQIFKENAIEIMSDEIAKDSRSINGKVDYNGKINHPSLKIDSDNRVKLAQCDCSYFRYNKLKFGPCRHIVALSLMGGK